LQIKKIIDANDILYSQAVTLRGTQLARVYW